MNVFDIAKQRLDNRSQKPEESTPETYQEEPIVFRSARSKLVDQKKPNLGKEVQSYEGENDLEREIERNISRTTSRAIEKGLGAAGDIQQFAKSLIGLPIFGALQLPTTEKIRETIGSSEYLQPKNEFEEKADQFTQDVISLSLPGSSSHSLLRNVGIAVAGSLGKKAAKELGASPETQELTKQGLMTVLDIMNIRKTEGKGGAKKFASSLFQESESLVPEGAKINAGKYASSLEKLEKDLNKGGTSPKVEPALKKIKELKDKIHDGEITVDELVSARKKINDIIESGGGFEYSPHPKVKKQALHHLREVKSKVIDALDEYGKMNPEFGNMNKSANEAYAAYSASNSITNFLKRNFGDKISDAATKVALGLASPGAIAGAKFFPLTTVAAASATPVYLTTKILRRISGSPTLRKYYGNILRYSLQENIPLVDDSIKKFQKEMRKEEKSHTERVSSLRSQAKDERQRTKNQ
jgi:anti-sigma28 factor (negative regulator of flagellin synthesis)